jgi:predicted nucleic acid-binding protein
MMIADASVWINLVATGAPHRILQALPWPLAITDVALDELDRGRPKGRRSADEVVALIHMGLSEVVPLVSEDEALFLSLVAGAASQTLDDGEAATLACAVRLGAGVVIDERKATSLAGLRFAALEVRSTCDLLLGPNVRSALGGAGLGDALFGALIGARMRVSDDHVPTVINLIGDRAEACLSIPARFRTQGGVSKDQLRAAVGKVGDRAEGVESELRGT